MNIRKSAWALFALIVVAQSAHAGGKGVIGRCENGDQWCNPANLDKGFILVDGGNEVTAGSCGDFPGTNLPCSFYRWTGNPGE